MLYEHSLLRESHIHADGVGEGAQTPENVMGAGAEVGAGGGALDRRVPGGGDSRRSILVQSRTANCISLQNAR